MKICGLTKTTLLDYPGKTAATIFVGGCNFRCPYCHNGDLVLNSDELPKLNRVDVLKFLRKRRNVLEGVCISGGEPTMHGDTLYFLIKRIRELGYPVKLDTNGSNPELVTRLVESGLVQKVAMDVKGQWSVYDTITMQDWRTGKELASVNKIVAYRVQETAKFLMNGGVDYEFRTTVVSELHSREDFEEIGQWFAGAREYYLQQFVESPECIGKGLTPCSREQMEEYLAILQRTIPNAKLRGIE